MLFKTLTKASRRLLIIILKKKKYKSDKNLFYFYIKFIYFVFSWIKYTSLKKQKIK